MFSPVDGLTMLGVSALIRARYFHGIEEKEVMRHSLDGLCVFIGRFGPFTVDEQSNRYFDFTFETGVVELVSECRCHFRYFVYCVVVA